MGRLDGKVALITGAGKGIGAASARMFAREGAKIVCTDLDEEAGEAVVADINAKGGLAVFMRHQVTDEIEWEAAVALARHKFGGLHVVLNNAGIATPGAPVEDMTIEQWRHTLAVNLDGVFLGCKHGVRAIKETTAKGGPGGSIINVSSILGLVGNANSADYNSAKGGVRLLTKCVALECAEAGYRIRVNSIHPGYIDTPLVRNAANSMGGGDAAGANAVLDMLVTAHPIGRLGIADEIASAALYLASDESSFTTGSEMVVDGGYTCR
ncbi:MAG: glucose 1-dehydrogenase [Rhizobiales bacterium]|nr:glucose 1-dehydrogenase [Hyphomicrobiales bacterium]